MMMMMTKAAVDEAGCLDSSTAASPAVTLGPAEQLLLLLNDNSHSQTSPRYQHNTLSPSVSAKESSQDIDNCTVIAFGSTPATGCSSLTTGPTVTQVATTTKPADSSNNNAVKNRVHKSSDVFETETTFDDSIRGNPKFYAKPKTTTELCCTTSASTATQDRLITNNFADKLTTLAITEKPFTSSTTTDEYGQTASIVVDLSVAETRSEDYTVSSNKRSNETNSPLNTAAVLASYESFSRTTVRTDTVTRNQTFNFVFSGNCQALRRRGAEAVKRFRSVVVDALSSGLSVSVGRLVAGDLRCGSLNLSITLLDARDDDVQWLMKTLSAATLRVSVEDVDETFVLQSVEPAAATRTRVRSAPGPRMVATTTTGPSPDLSQGSVAILVVFIIIGVLAMFAGTVSAAVYLYFRRMYCRTFVVNRRALRWSSRASDTVHVINVDDEDSASNGTTTRPPLSGPVPHDWSPPISVTGFDEGGERGGRLPMVHGWSPPRHYCQARFRRLIPALPPGTMTSFPEELLDEGEEETEATVDLTAFHNSFRPRRCQVQTSIVSLHQPLSSDFHIATSTPRQANEDGGATSTLTDAGYQCEFRKKDASRGLNGSSIQFDWIANDFCSTTSSGNGNKEKATPF